MGSPVPAQPGALVAGRYEIEHELARGGMGVVYRAIDRATGQAIALKRTLNEHLGEGHKDALRLEYQTLVTLRHPHIIQVFDFGVDESGPYYTMELLDGTDLRAKCPLPWREVCRYLRDVASSLALLHSRRLIHCDVGVANVRLTGEGRAKLIDFGALSSFGPRNLIAGTPPTTAPEVLEGLDLDQRVDLYALGATAYYALTGRHAYPATMLALLRAVWERGPPDPPSTAAPEVPPELDSLVLSLLALDRGSRPASAAEVIDRIDAISGFTPDQDQRVLRSYLLGGGLVGRDAERAALRDRLEQALSGAGGGMLISGGYGLGKSALLDEVVQRARIAGARVLTVDARAHRDAPAATWAALVSEAVLSGEITAPKQASDQSSEEVFLRLAEKGPLVLAIEDMHEADHDSLVACAALIRSVRRHRILLLATADLDHTRDKPGLRLLRERLPCLELRPFDARATEAFVEALFGKVPAVVRLATFLHHHATGNPRTCAEVVAHLIEKGFIRYAEGAWILPHEVSAADTAGLEIGTILDAAFKRRVERWGAPLLSLALCLSPNRKRFDLELCRALVMGETELRGQGSAQLLGELVREGVLVTDQGGYAFARARTRDLLYQMLEEGHRKKLHARLARAIEQSDSTGTRGFEIGVHYLLAGEIDQARSQINRDLQESLINPERLVSSAPDVWALLEQQRAAGARDEDLLFAEAVLVISGYYIDPSVQDRFGERVLPALYERTGFALATRLSRYLGAPLAILVGTVVAFFRSLLPSRDLVRASFANLFLAFVGVCSSMSGVACFRLDRAVHPRLLGYLSVAKGLGRLMPLRLVYDLIQTAMLIVKGRFTEAHAGLEDQLERLPRVLMLTPQARHHYESALHFFIGRSLLLQGGSKVLRSVERIEALGEQQDRVMAQFLRRTYYLYQGDLEGLRREEARLDELGARFGTHWISDMLGVLEFVPYHLSGDVIGLKQTLHRITRLLTMAPGLSTHRHVVEAMYEGHRGRPGAALAIYRSIEVELAPFTNPIWTLARAHQAECLNALGRQAEALAVCQGALAHLTEADRVNVFVYQQLEREAAIALSSLARFDEATARIDALLAKSSEEQSPLIFGLLHADRARIACAARDREAFERHAERAREIFAKTENPALIARGRRLADLARAAGLQTALSGAREDDQDALLRRAAGPVTNARAQRLLEDAVAVVGARSAGLYLLLFGKSLLCAQYGELDTALHAEVNQATSLLASDPSEGAMARVLGSARANLPASVNLLPLVAAADGARQLVGLLLLVDCDRAEAVSDVPLAQFASELSEADEVTETS